MISVLLTFLLSACGIVKTGKRPKYSGPIETPSWKVDGIRVDQVFIGNHVVFCRARSFSSDDERLYAFNADDGAKLWVSGFEPAMGDSHFFIEGLLVIHDADKHVHVLDSKTGVAVPGAEKELAGALRGSTRDGVRYIVTPGRLTASTNGKKVWEAEAPAVVDDGPFITASSVLVAGPGDQTSAIYAFDRATGAAKWKWSFHGYGSGLVTDDSAAYAYSGAGGAPAVVAIDAESGAVKWSQPLTRAQTIGSPKLLGGSLLIEDNPGGKDGTLWESGYVLRTLNCATGAKEQEVTTTWKYPNWVATGAYGNLFASDKSSGGLLNEGGDEAPDSWISGIGLSDGKEKWRTATVHYGVFTPLAAAAGIVAVGISPYNPPVPKPGDPMPSGLWAFKVPER